MSEGNGSVCLTWGHLYKDVSTPFLVYYSESWHAIYGDSLTDVLRTTVSCWTHSVASDHAIYGDSLTCRCSQNHCELLQCSFNWTIVWLVTMNVIYGEFLTGFLRNTVSCDNPIMVFLTPDVLRFPMSYDNATLSQIRNHIAVVTMELDLSGMLLEQHPNRWGLLHFF